MIRIFASRIITTAVVAAAVLGTEPAFADAPRQELPAANMRIIHAIPDVPSVDVYVNDQQISNVGYKQLTGYVLTPASDARIQVVPRGQTIEQGPVMIDVPFQFGTGKNYTLALAGTLAKPEFHFFFDDWNAPGKGKAKTRFVRLSPGAPPVDVTLPKNGNARLAQGVEPGKASDYVELDAGTFDLSVVAAGTTDAALNQRVTFKPGKVYTLFAVGLVGARPLLSLVTSEDASATPARLRVLHASPDAPAADVYLDGARVLRNVRYRAISNYLNPLPGDYHLQIVPSGKSLTQGPAVIDTQMTLEPGKVYVVAVADVLANIKPIVAVDDGKQPTSGRGLIRVWHLSPDVPAVDVMLPENGNAKIVLGVEFGEVTDYLDIEPGSYQGSVRPVGTADQVIGAPIVVAVDGVHTFYITGLANGNPALAASVRRDR